LELQMGNRAKDGLSRRALFKGVAGAGAGAALVAAAGPEKAKAAAPASAAEPSAAAMARETQTPPHEPGLMGRTGGDYMVDAIKQLDIPYAATMAGSSFRGLHEALINYGGNASPEILTTLHEEISVGLAHGYAKVTGKPLISLLHGTVGVQHAAMAVYNAWCDRAPVILIGGNTLDGTKRRAGVEWNHSVLDQGATLRDFLKWDAQPLSPLDFNEALKRGYQLATSPPYGPVLIMVDGELQENLIPEGLRPEPLRMTPTNPVGDPAAVEAAAKLLVAAQSPVIIADRLVRTPAGMQNLVQLAELLQAPVLDRGGRLNIPTTHYLCQNAVPGHVRGADVILGLEMSDPYGTFNNIVDVEERYSEPSARKDVRFIHISSRDLLVKSNYQDFQRYQPAEFAITGDGETTLPYLLEAVRRAIGDGDRSRIAGRKAKHEAAYRDAKQRAKLAATFGWDASPIATGRWCAELYMAVRDLDWTLIGGGGFIGNWPQRLWDFDQPHQYTGGSGGGGVGYGGPASLGVGLAHRGQGRLPISIIGDGDLLCCPTSLWTAAHHKIPMLFVVHNNRAYHQEVMHVQRMANRRGRGPTTAHIGTVIDNPNIDFARMAQSFGVVGIGPVADPKDLAPAFKRAVEVVKAGEPVLVDVVSQPR
jgi:thiamine pyrophosphate-dependent acetolactate synthase large subunit-like protein